jgi:circadian clock protein KaiC
MPLPPDADAAPERIPTGTEGLDAILGGGFVPGHSFLLQGAMGTGKTTLALQFAMEGVRRDERVLYITLSQTPHDLHQIARSHGWSLEGIRVEDLGRGTAGDLLTTRQNALHPADVELGETIDALREVFTEVQPDRFIFDSIGVLHILAAGQEHRYHAEVGALIRLIKQHQATSLIIGRTATNGSLPHGSIDGEIQTLVHSAVRLVREAPAYGALRRRLQVEKGRGMTYQSGWHNFTITPGALTVFPRLNIASDQTDVFEASEELGEVAGDAWEHMESGVVELDEMLGGGFEFGTAALIVGATGTGKSTLATLYAHAALQQGRKAAVFLFTERPWTYARRSAQLAMDIRPFLKEGQLHLQTVDVGDLSPGAFADCLRSVVEDGVEVVVIDSLTGYYHAMGQEALLQVQMHDMLRYMAERGVLALLVVDQHGMVGSGEITPIDISYMCDSLVLLRNYDEGGRIRRAIAVVKKRYGAHDLSVRELQITGEGLRVGEPREDLIGVLTGSPTVGGGPSEDGSPERPEEAP